MNRTRAFPDISFITFDSDKPYGFADANFFDVPNQDYSAGNLQGSKMVWELFKAARDVEDFDCYTSVILAAAQIKRSVSANSGDSRLGAAIGFLGTLENVLAEAARKLDIGAIVKNDLHWFEQSLANDLKETRASNAEFVRAMTQPDNSTETRKAA